MGKNVEAFLLHGLFHRKKQVNKVPTSVSAMTVMSLTFQLW